MENEIMDNLVKQLRLLIGGRVEKATLMIWPDMSANLNEMDIEFNLKLKLPFNEIKNITFRMDSDGQTPLIDNEEVEQKYDISELPSRMETWKTFEFWSMIDDNIKSGKGHYMYDCFNVENSIEYAGVVGAKIVKIGLYYIQDKKFIFFKNGKYKYPFGLFIEFSTGSKVWII